MVARAEAKIPVTGEVLQVRRANIVGAQGHSGHGTFPRVIQSMASGMNMLPLITKEIKLDDVPENNRDASYRQKRMQNHLHNGLKEKQMDKKKWLFTEDPTIFFERQYRRSSKKRSMGHGYGPKSTKCWKITAYPQQANWAKQGATSRTHPATR